MPVIALLMSQWHKAFIYLKKTKSLPIQGSSAQQAQHRKWGATTRQGNIDRSVRDSFCKRLQHTTYPVRSTFGILLSGEVVKLMYSVRILAANYK